MKASIYHQYGQPEVLQLAEMPTPDPKENEVLVKVWAATVNRTDCAMLTAKPFIMRFFLGLFKPKNKILGTDFAGEIVAVGKQVKSFNIGDRVFGFDDDGLSSHAEYLTINENKPFVLMPANVSFEQATASIEGAHYAYNFINKVNLKKGEKVLVNGASGAIGSAAVQLLKYYGADITAVCNTKNIELVKQLGASHVIDYLKEDFIKTGEKYNYIFDTVGKSSFAKCKPLLLSGGIYISSELGYMSQNIFYSLRSLVYGNKKVKFPLPVDKKGSVLFIKKLLEERHFNPVIDRTYPLENIADAFSYVLTGKKTGNVVVKMD